MDNHFLIGVFTRNGVLDAFNNLNMILSGSRVCRSLRYPRVFGYFLSHGLFNFSVNGVFAKYRIVLLQLQTVGSVFPVFLCNVAGSAWHACRFMLCAFQYDLQSVPFALLGHFSTFF
jgi:hypothetical protein